MICSDKEDADQDADLIEFLVSSLLLLIFNLPCREEKQTRKRKNQKVLEPKLKLSNLNNKTSAFMLKMKNQDMNQVQNALPK